MSCPRRASLLRVLQGSGLNILSGAVGVLGNVAQFFVVFIIGGMNAGAARSLAPVRACYLAYVLVTLTPAMVRFAQLQLPGSWTLSTTPE